MPNAECRMPNGGVRTPGSAFVIRHSSSVIPGSAARAPHFSQTPNPEPRTPFASSARLPLRLLDILLVASAALAIALRPLLPGHGAEMNLWVEVCAFIAGMVWIVRMAMERHVRVVSAGLAAPLLVLLAIAGVSTVRSPHTIASLAVLFEWLSYAVLFFVLANLVAERVDPRFFLRLLWASAFAVILFGLFQQFVNLPLLREQILADPKRVQLELHLTPENYNHLAERARGRIFATFLLANSFAGFLALVVPGFLGYVLDRVREGRRSGVFLAVAAAWVAGALACLVYTGSAGGSMAFVVGLAAFCLLAWGGRLRRGAPWIAAAAALAVLVIAAVSMTHRVPKPVRDAMASYDVRIGYWRGGLAMAEAHPVAGVGLGTFGDHYPRYRWPLARMAQAAHNDYLQVFAELGLVGLAAFLWLWVAYFRSAAASGSSSVLAVPPGDKGPEAGGARDEGKAQDKKPSGLAPPASSLSAVFPPRLGYVVGILAFVLSDAIATAFAFGGWGTEPWWQTVPKSWCDLGLVVALGAAWLLFFALLGRGETGATGPLSCHGWLAQPCSPVARSDEPTAAQPGPLGPLCRKGLIAGVIALLFHMTGDFDYCEPGVAMAAWVVIALSVVPRRTREWRPRPVAAALLGAGSLIAVVAFQLILLRAVRANDARTVASERVAEALRLDPTQEGERQQRLLWEGIELYDHALGDNPLDDALRIDCGDLLTSLLSKDPDDPRLFRRAAALYERAAELNPVSAGPHLRLGDLYERVADYCQGHSRARVAEPLRELVARQGSSGYHPQPSYLPAVAELRAAVERDPNRPSWRLRLAEALNKLGDQAEALREAQFAQGLNDALLREHPQHEMSLRPDELSRLRDLFQRLPRPH